MAKPIHILHVVSRMDRGGAEIRTMEILRRLDRRRFRLSFCALSGQPGKFDDEIRRLGGEVFPLRRTSPAFPLQFRALLNRHRFDAIHSQVLYFSGIVLGLAARCGMPVRVAQLHNTHDGRHGGPLRSAWRACMRRAIRRHATRIVGVSEGVLDSIVGPDWSNDPRCTAVYNGVDTAPYEAAAEPDGVRRKLGLGPGSPLCLHVGRMLPQKNHARLIAIFAEVLRRRADAHLVVVGQRDEAIEHSLRRQIDELSIADRVLLAGRRDDVPRLMKAAGVLLLPSRWEGLPGVVQEACAAGTPVVASDLPGVRELDARLSGVRRIDLSQSDAHWADAIAGILARPVSEQDRQRALRAFGQSEFTIQRCTDTFQRIWQGRTPEPMHQPPSLDTRAA